MKQFEKLCRNRKCLLLSLQQSRFQSSSARPVSEKPISSNQLSEWDRAKPFDQMPSMSAISLTMSFLPGGKFHNVKTDDLLKILQKDFGDIYRLPGMLGKPSMVITYNADDFEKVFRVDGKWPIRKGSELIGYHRSEQCKDFFQGIEGLISTQHEKWGTFRSAVNPILLKPGNVKLYTSKLSDVSMELIERIREIRDPNTHEVPGTFEDEISRWALDSVSVVALDKKIGLLRENRNSPDADQLFSNLLKFLKLSSELELGPAIWKILPTSKFKQAMKALDNVNEVTKKYVKEAIERLEKNKDDGDVEGKKPEGEKSILEKLLKIDKMIATVMAMDMLMAGVDTTTTATTGILLCLAKNPEKQEKLRKEIRKILPKKDSPLSGASLNNIPYLRACIKEGLRHYPLSLGNMRNVQRDVVLSGYRVPKGQDVIMAMTSLLRDSKCFTNPDAFSPERWLRELPDLDMNKLHPFASLPFGFGPRGCIGKRIAEMEIQIGIARIIRNFDVEFNHSTENAFKALLINVPAIPLRFKFTDIAE